MPETILEKLKSRKLWMAVFTQALLVFVMGVMDLPQEQASEIAQWIVSIAATYILGQSYTDGKTQAPRVSPRVLPRTPRSLTDDEPTSPSAS